LLARQWAKSAALRAFVKQVVAAAEAIASAHPEGRIVVVAHGGTIDALLTHYFPREDQWERGVIRNCSLTQILLSPSGCHLLAFNDCKHLP
jgi:probable phosphoglycerate mutase